MYRTLHVSLVLVFLVLLGCSQAPEKLCNKDEICGKGQICVQGTCLEGCRESKQCEAGQTCLESKCVANVCKLGDKRDCYTGVPATQDKGPCRGGFQLCLPDGSGWSPCYEQTIPVAEICDGTDNDCDGEIDEKLICDCQEGDSRRCYTGPLDSVQQGLCRAGIQYCTSQRRWGACLDQVRPRREICDGLDNDCNGRIDDQISCDCEPGATRECYSGPDGTAGVGLCQKGNQVCNPERKWEACQGQVLPVLEESPGGDLICNGLDENCDGHADNVSGTQEPLKKRCYSGPPGTAVAPCQQGLSTCVDRKWSACQGEVVPLDETCNGKDDDCNGKIDDLKPIPCFEGKTGCLQVGDTYQCKGNCSVGLKRCEQGQWTDCQGQTLAAAEEKCGDGLDNDCNGAVDEQCVCTEGQKQACYTGPNDTRSKGECKEGEQVCSNNAWSACSKVVLPQAEVCNGKDDNCDGTVDNITDLGKSCVDTQRKGECSRGTTRCKESQPGQWTQACEPTVQPGTEVCNGKDDDCDGVIDNIASYKQACLRSQEKGNCQQGQWLCVLNGTTIEKTCQPIKPAKAEICNGEDDNCDGIVDNIGTPCIVNNQSGNCQYGRTLCQRVQKGTSYVWESKCQPAPSLPEICNGQDDDCNGTIDDIKDLGAACSDSTRKGNCATGKWACVTTSQGTNKTCLPAVSPTAEICNGQDDDCDGLSDNLSGTCAVKDPKIQGSCRQGIRTCTYNTTQKAWEEQCQAKAPGTEVCNGLDDNCNGTVDDVQGAGQPCVDTNKLGACRAGVTQCQNGKVECIPKNPQPLNESCNNEDDDCDGKVDNGIAARPCQTPCGQGTETCRQGQWINCTAQVPVPEGTSCNGKDDDCDGITDNFGPCTLTSVKGNCAQGEKRCNSQNQIVCTQILTPVLEIGCNGKDDDCDGSIDETFPHTGKLCVLTAGNGTLGYVTCQAGNIVCIPPPNTQESWLPPGTYTMGTPTSDAIAYSYEKPDHSVTITRPFAMMRFEATRDEFVKLIGYDTVTTAPTNYLKIYGNCKNAKQCPVYNVTWHHAALYANALSKAAGLEECYSCTKATPPTLPSCRLATKWQGANFLRCPGYRLPTEGEWEYAYRAGTTSMFYNGYNCSSQTVCSYANTTTRAFVDSIAWYGESSKESVTGYSSSYAQLKPVGKKQANPWFLHDMAGNVSEWVQDWWGPYTTSAQIDPLGPTSGSWRGHRGGSNRFTVIHLRASMRFNLSPDGSSNTFTLYFMGVRPARTLLQPFYCTTDKDCSILTTPHTCQSNTCTP